MRLVCWVALAVSVAPCFAQEVQYTLEFPNAVHHEAEIEARFEGAPRLLELRMSRSSPGRYATHEFVRNIYNVRVSDGVGRALPVTRPNVHQWNVTGHNGTVVVRYTLFADTADGTYASIDAARAVLNTPACLLWARGLQNRPAIVTVKPPANANWKVATQLQQISEMKFALLTCSICLTRRF
jgi:predicted metalloprotease with PDZ domain